MVAIQVLPLEPDPWPDVDDGHADTDDRQPRRQPPPLPDRATRYRRRRLGALVCLVAFVAVAFAVVDVLAGGPRDVRPPTGDARAQAPIVGEVYVVQPGDTLWSIAERVAPRSDPRRVVAELREMTGGVQLDAGDRIPVGDLASP